MKKYLKAIGIGLAALILLMIFIPFLFKGKIRELVVNQANKNLNAVVSLGDLNISLFRNFPNASLGLKNLTVTNREPFQGDTLAHIPRLALTVDLIDLLNGSPYTIDRIHIGQPDVRLRVMHDGQVNWDIALPDDTLDRETEKPSSSSFRLKLKSLVIEEGRLMYDDVSLPAYVVLEGLDHRLSGDLTADRSILATRTSVKNAYIEYAHIAYMEQAVIELVADIDADLQNSIYNLKDNHLKINELVLNFDGSVGYVGDDMNLLLTYQAPENSFKNLLSLVPAIYTNDFSGIQTDGTFSLNGFVKGMYTEDSLPAFLVDLAVDNASFKYPDLPGAVTGITLAGRVDNPGGDYDNTVIDLTSFAMTILDNPITGSLRLAHPVSDPDIDLALDGVLDLADIASVYPLEAGDELHGNVAVNAKLKGRLSDIENENYNEFQAMGSILTNNLSYTTSYLTKPVEITNAQLNISPAYLDLVSLDASIGNSDLSANGKIQDYLSYFLADGALRGHLMLQAGRLDLNEWMQATGDEDPLAEEPQEKSASDSSEMTAFIVPSDLDFIIDAEIGLLNYETIEMKNTRGRIEIRDSKLWIKGMTTDLFGGKVLLNGSYETTDPSSPLVDFALGLTGADIAEMTSHIPAMERFAPIASKTLGKITGNINLASVLDGQMMPVYETILGMGNLNTTRMQISGVNSLNSLADALKMESLRSILVDPLNVSFQLMEGVLNVKPFDIKSGDVNMNLSGWTSYTQEIGYVLNMKIPRSLFGGQANDVLDDLLSRANQLGTDFSLGDQVELKALIDGTLTDPKVKLDLAGTGKGILEQVQEEIKQEVVKQLSEEAQKILAEARASADAILAQARIQADALLAEAGKLADETRKQANLNADNLEKQAAGQGALAVLAAQKSAEEIRKQGDNQAQNILNEARKQSDNLIQKAQQEADRILDDANKRVESYK